MSGSFPFSIPVPAPSWSDRSHDVGIAAGLTGDVLGDLLEGCEVGEVWVVAHVVEEVADGVVGLGGFAEPGFERWGGVRHGGGPFGQ